MPVRATGEKSAIVSILERTGGVEAHMHAAIWVTKAQGFRVQHQAGEVRSEERRVGKEGRNQLSLNQLLEYRTIATISY